MVHVPRERSIGKFWLTARFWRRGVNTVVEPRISEILVDYETMTAQLTDGRVIFMPLAWSWRLSEATPHQRNNREQIGVG
jgi:hypothetical protein